MSHITSFKNKTRCNVFLKVSAALFSKQLSWIYNLRNVKETLTRGGCLWNWNSTIPSIHQMYMWSLVLYLNCFILATLCGSKEVTQFDFRLSSSRCRTLVMTRHPYVEITCGVKTRQLHSHVKISCEVKNKP